MGEAVNVRELIEHLSQFDPELPVKVRSRPDDMPVPLDIYPPFDRSRGRGGVNDHVLIESEPGASERLLAERYATP